MPQLTVEHKKIPQKESRLSTPLKTEHVELELVENKREGKGRDLAISRHVFFLLSSKDVYYVQSEHSDNIYYYVKYYPDVLEWCSCPDSSIRGIKCKHQFAIEYAIKKGTLKDIEKLPKEAIRFTNQQQEQIQELEAVVSYHHHSYMDDEYSF